MKTFTYKIKDSAGIHARPAGMIVKRTEGFKSDIEISFKDKTANAKRLFSLMGLGAAEGDEITVKISGCDEDEAKDLMLKFLEETL